MDAWPYDLLTPFEERWRLQGVALNGGVTVAGTAKLSRTDAGGLWVGEQSFSLDGRQQIKVARAIEAGLDGGAGRIVAWSHEEPFAPGDLALAQVAHSDGSPFVGGAEYLTAPHGATLGAEAALRATTLTVTMISGSLEGGENFSIVHPTKGWRRYRVRRVDGDQVEIRPPLREAAVAGTEINFLRVGCVCRLANPEEFMGALTAAQVVEVTARWVEAF